MRPADKYILAIKDDITLSSSESPSLLHTLTMLVIDWVVSAIILWFLCSTSYELWQHHFNLCFVLIIHSLSTPEKPVFCFNAFLWLFKEGMRSPSGTPWLPLHPLHISLSTIFYAYRLCAGEPNNNNILTISLSDIELRWVHDVIVHSWFTYWVLITRY